MKWPDLNTEQRVRAIMLAQERWNDPGPVVESGGWEVVGMLVGCVGVLVMVGLLAAFLS
jgi:hypothetical protein